MTKKSQFKDQSQAVYTVVIILRFQIGASDIGHESVVYLLFVLYVSVVLVTLTEMRSD